MTDGSGLSLYCGPSGGRGTLPLIYDWETLGPELSFFRALLERIGPTFCPKLTFTLPHAWG